MPDGNPYARMAALMRGGVGAQGVRMYRGNVVQTQPLSVAAGGVRLPAEALKRGAQLHLDPGDTVLLLTEDDQVFYIIMKVVDAV